jgi:hypothetical protein
MSFEFDVDELEETEVGYVEEGGSEYDDEPMEFEEIDFEALGIDPKEPTVAKPGSEEKVLILAARYAAGVPLWHDSDCYEHGPGEALLRMAQKG